MSGELRSRIDTGTLTGGIIMITLGVLFLLTRLDLADFGQIVRRHWPLIIVIIGAVKLFARETVWSGLWLVTLGAWLQIAHLGLFGMTYRSSWPLLLIALGGGMVLRSFVEAALRSREEHHES
jgi:hypothetical protein